jgi:Tol biopolymer transport system component/tRNA A-37 threonylcarbamoyl transferase component Bud32
MAAERWRRIDEVYRAALTLEGNERAAFLTAACAGDAELRQAVDQRLGQDPQEPTEIMLVPGRQLGPYRIDRLLGKGGMGQVFLALDTRLDRKVAVKVCPAEFIGRFAREARAIAALNHPHICTLYDVGDNYLVMELIEGETLAARIAKGPLSTDEVLRYGGQVADALTAAHALGIVHRDLKPGNIMLTAAGVKVLDFGLAKVSDDETVTGSRFVVGTPAYMSPEQRQGRQCDSRTDVYSLGVVLHEMATGKRPAGGVSGSLARPVAHVVERCLADDPDARWQTARDVRTELEWASRTGDGPAPRWRRYAIALGLAAAGVVGVLGIMKALWHSSPADAPVVRLAIPLPEESVSTEPPGTFGAPAVSPDGRTFAISLGSAGNRSVWLRRFDTGRFERLAGSDGAHFVFWSADSRQIGFATLDGKLMAAAANGGSPRKICSFTPQSFRGATWNASGTIVYGVNYEGLYRVSEAGGAPVKLAGLDPALEENSLRNPAFLRDGLRFLCFSRTANLDNRGLYLYTLDGIAQRKKLAVTDQMIAVGLDSSTAREYALFSKAGKLWAQLIDPSLWQLAGEPVAIDEDVGLFSASDTGTLVYRRNAVEYGQYTWFDRSGRELGAVGAPVDSWDVELSPDDRHLAFQNHRSLDGNFSIWLVDTVRNVAAPFSAQNERSFGPVWSRDGARLYFTSARPPSKGASLAAFVKAVDDAAPESSFPAAGATWLEDLSPDSRYLLGVVLGASNGRSLTYTEFGKEVWTPLAKAEGSQTRPHFSPDGRWVAYDSTESGTPEVYVVDFPAGRRKQRISVAGGKEARWARDGKEIVYYAPDGSLMSAAYGGGAATGAPASLFRIRFSTEIDGFHYAMSRDGQRILAMKEVGRQRSRDLNVVMNWPHLLRKEP